MAATITQQEQKRTMHREGFYRDPYVSSSELPVPLPRETAWKGEREFREKLAVLEGRVHVVTRIADEGRVACLFCDTQLTKTQFWVLGQWKWTAGLFHYVTAHHVRPSLGFQEFVLGRELR